MQYPQTEHAIIDEQRYGIIQCLLIAARRGRLLRKGGDGDLRSQDDASINLLVHVKSKEVKDDSSE